MKFTIKKADLKNPSMVTLICYLQNKILPSDEIFKPDRCHWWIAYTEDERPIGFAGLVRSYKWTDTGYLCRAGVMDGYTGHGLQKRLILLRLRQAKKLGWNWVITDTTNNPPSSNSLINCGFKIYNPRSPWGLKNAIYWRYKVLHNAVQGQRSKKAKAQRVQP